jgi:hypothetical protein
MFRIQFLLMAAAFCGGGDVRMPVKTPTTVFFVADKIMCPQSLPKVIRFLGPKNRKRNQNGINVFNKYPILLQKKLCLNSDFFLPVVFYLLWILT